MRFFYGKQQLCDINRAQEQNFLATNGLGGYASVSSGFGVNRCDMGILVAAVTGCFIIRGAYGNPGQDCRYVIVLGAGVNGSVPSLSLRERIDAAYEYLVAYPQAICIVSGGQGNNEDISEAECMFRELTAMGIEADRVWMEDKATSTRENLRFSLALIEQRTGSRPESVGLISSE